jgi:hypothetical protein
VRMSYPSSSRWVAKEWRNVCGVAVHLHGTGYAVEGLQKVFSRFPVPRRYNIPILLGPHWHHKYCELSSPV